MPLIDPDYLRRLAMARANIGMLSAIPEEEEEEDVPPPMGRATGLKQPAFDPLSAYDELPPIRQGERLADQDTLNLAIGDMLSDQTPGMTAELGPEPEPTTPEGFPKHFEALPPYQPDMTYDTALQPHEETSNQKTVDDWFERQGIAETPTEFTEQIGPVGYGLLGIPFAARMAHEAASAGARIADAREESRLGLPLSHPYRSGFDIATLAPLPGAAATRGALKDLKLMTRTLDDIQASIKTVQRAQRMGEISKGDASQVLFALRRKHADIKKHVDAPRLEGLPETAEIPGKPQQRIYRGVEGGTDRHAALRYFKGGDLGDGIYFTPNEKIAKSYGGGPNARISDGTRVVHDYGLADLPPEQRAYMHGGMFADNHVVTIKDGTGKEIYKGEWKPDQIEEALKKAPDIKVVIGTEKSIGLNQISVRDKSILDRPAGGQTVEVGPHPPAREAAASYMHEQSFPFTPPTKYEPVDPKFAARVGEAYGRMKHDPMHPDVKHSYRTFARETQDQWDMIKATGLKVEFIKPGMESPYAASPRMALEDIRKNNHLWVYPTDSGFGAEAGAMLDASDNPLLGHTGEKIDGHKVRYNDLFRIVHDYFGHMKEGVGFRATGEENAYRSHSSLYSDDARPAMATETRGQSSWLNFGPHGEKNRTASEAETVFADQKTGLMPRWAEGPGPAPEGELGVGLSRYRSTEPQTIREATEGAGGYTVNLQTGEVPKTGLMMGKYANTDPRNQVIQGPLLDEHILQHAKKNVKPLEREENYFGAWKEAPTDERYLDVTRRFEPDQKRQAVKYGEKTGQKMGFDIEADELFKVGNWMEHIQSDKFHNLMDDFAAKGRDYMSGHPTWDWWPFKGSSMERVYGKKRSKPAIGYTASTSSNTAPEPNVQMMSEYMRRDIKGEPVIQPNYTIPEDAMGGRAGGPGKRMGLEADPKTGYLTGARSNNLRASRAGDLEALSGPVVRGKSEAMQGKDVAVMDRWWARLSEDIENNVFSGTEEGVIPDNMQPHLQAQIETAAKRNGETVAKYSADVWAGVREHVKKFGELNGQKYNAKSVQGESKSYYDIFDDLIVKKAKHLGISVKEMEKRLRNGDAELLSVMLGTPFIARLMLGGPERVEQPLEG